MRLNRPLAYLLVAVAGLAFGFVAAAQVRAQLINPTDRLARNQALVRSVQDLERINSDLRAGIDSLRADVGRLEAAAASRSQADREAAQQLQVLRAHAGLVALRGPGLRVKLGNGVPSSDPQELMAHLVSFQDVQDVVNALYLGGAEGVAVNGHRISPVSSYRGAGANVLIDQAQPMTAPFTIDAVGDQERLNAVMGDPANLIDLRLREQRFQLKVSWERASGLVLPAYDSSITVTYAHPS